MQHGCDLNWIEITNIPSVVMTDKNVINHQWHKVMEKKVIFSTRTNLKL